MSEEAGATARANATASRSLVDEWRRGGVTHAVVAPGSRSTPLALALADHPEIELRVHVDERSASFLALGLAKATRRPVVLLCTSGTAAANFHPAVLEAYHARVPLLVCTADRPPELRGVGAPQTVDQHRLYGTAARWYVEVEAPAPGGEPTRWRALAAQALGEATGPPAGPVHLNLPLRDPLYTLPCDRPPFDVGGRSGDRPWAVVPRGSRRLEEGAASALAERLAGAEKGVLLAGFGAGLEPGGLDALARATGWPVLADPVSNLRAGPHAVSTYDALARVESVAAALQPDLALRVGAPLTSKAAMARLGSVPTVVVDPDRTWTDPERAGDTVVVADTGPLVDDLASRLDPPGDGWWRAWSEAETRARHALDAQLDTWGQPFEGRVARDVMAHVPAGGALVVASSMPVRDLESFAAPRHGVTVFANRGVNGIDGFVSTALGVAGARAGSPTVALVGDLCFLHDSNGLAGSARRRPDCTFVVVDNHGGGIFSFLPQADEPEHFETLFGTPVDVDLGPLAEAYGVPVTPVDTADGLLPALDEALAAGGVRLVHVRTDRADNLRRHREVSAAVERALDT